MGPKQIGRYVIVRELGRGGMAIVYLAHDPYMDRHIAIKVLPSQFTFDQQFLDRFRREVKVVALLEHPSIVPVYDYGEFDNQPYIVMRYMSGGSLAKELKKGPLTLSETSRILVPISIALDEAHSKGLIHRDLKPQNIMFDDRKIPYLADFGIAKIIEGSQTALTISGGIVGTPAYMSPEQAKGEGKLDGRSDIYSLGAIFFEMVTDKQPYEADTPMGLAMKHVLEPVPRALDSNPNLPPEVEEIIMKAMAKDPEDRYQNATALAAAVRKLISSNFNTTVFGVPGEIQESPPKSRRFPVSALIAGGIIVAFLCFMTAFYFVFINNARTSPDMPSPSMTVTIIETTEPTSTATTLPTTTPVPVLEATPQPTESPAPKPSPTLTPMATPTIVPSLTSTGTPTPLPPAIATRARIIPPSLLAPDYGVYKGLVTFEWQGSPGTAYQVTLNYLDGGNVHQSPWLTSTSWTFDLPGDQFGNWQWFVTDENGSQSETGSFVNDPFPIKDGGGGDDGGYPEPPTPEPPYP